MFIHVELGDNIEVEAASNKPEKKKVTFDKAFDILKHNTETLTDSNQIFQKKPRLSKTSKVNPDTADIYEIPGTQSPPKPLKKKLFEVPSISRSKMNSKEPSRKSFSGFEDKRLSRIVNEEPTRSSRGSASMLSSPSIMNPKPKRSLNASYELPKEIKPKERQPMTLAGIFDDEDKPKEKVSETGKKAIEETKLKQVEKDPTPDTSSTSCDEQESVDNLKTSPELPPIKPFQPISDLSSINADALRHLKENTANFREIIEIAKQAK